MLGLGLRLARLTFMGAFTCLAWGLIVTRLTSMRGLYVLGLGVYTGKTGLLGKDGGGRALCARLNNHIFTMCGNVKDKGTLPHQLFPMS